MQNTSPHRGPHWIASVMDLADVPTADLVDAMQELQIKVQMIEAQLGVSTEESLRLPGEHQWRKKAKIAMRMSLFDIGRIKTELRNRQNPDYNKPREFRKAIEILEDLVNALDSDESGLLVEEFIAEAKKLMAFRKQS